MKTSVSFVAVAVASVGRNKKVVVPAHTDIVPIDDTHAAVGAARALVGEVILLLTSRTKPTILSSERYDTFPLKGRGKLVVKTQIHKEERFMYD